MSVFDRKKRIRARFHLIDPHPQFELPTVEGLFVGFDRALNEYRVGVPRVITAVGADARELDCKVQRLPRERVAWWEEL